MLEKLNQWGASAIYWWAIALLGLSLEALALIYQYVFDYWPCVLCIHVRIWVLGLIVVAFVGLAIHRMRIGRIIGHVLMLLIAIGMLERSWMLFAIERGMAVDGECNFDTGLPAWFALDQWFPSVFKVWESCGYTPELLFGVTMAEALLVLSGALVTLGLGMIVSTLVAKTP